MALYGLGHGFVTISYHQEWTVFNNQASPIKLKNIPKKHFIRGKPQNNGRTSPVKEFTFCIVSSFKAVISRLDTLS